MRHTTMTAAERQAPISGARSSLYARAGMTACFIVTSAFLVSGLLESVQSSKSSAAASSSSLINAAALK